VKFLKYNLEINVIHEDVIIRFFYYLWKQDKITRSSIRVVQRVYLLLHFSLKNFSSNGA
jgi:hypothetical protein